MIFFCNILFKHECGTQVSKKVPRRSGLIWKADSPGSFVMSREAGGKKRRLAEVGHSRTTGGHGRTNSPTFLKHTHTHIRHQQSTMLVHVATIKWHTGPV